MTPGYLRLPEERILSSLGRQALFLDGASLAHRAVDVGETLSVLAWVPRRLAITALFCRLVTDGGEYRTERMVWRGTGAECDLYECALSVSDPGLCFYSFLGEGAHGRLFGMRGAGADEIAFSRSESGAHFQLTVTDFVYPAPRWLYGGIIYHIFVDRFFRVGCPPVREDAILNPDWDHGIPEYPAVRGGHMENNEFFGGTLDGIRKKLPELLALGVNCLYLSPIFEAYSNHKYDTGNYERIDEMFGGEEAFFRLLSAAEASGVRVILDAVFNHTGSDSIYFNRKGRYPSLGAYQSKASPYYGWYSFHTYPDTYDCWWGITTLPRLDQSSKTLRAFLTGDGGIVDRYARCGIGGLRLDVVDELPDDLVSDIKDRLAKSRPDAVLIGEVWEDASHKVAYGVRKRYYTGRELDSVMNYPLREGLISYFRYGDTERLSYALSEVLPNMPERIANAAMNLLGTHDTVRILTAIAGDAEEGKTMEELAPARLSPDAYLWGRRQVILAYLVIATLPGVASIFYGDEVGLEGYRDPLNRRPYPWKRRDLTMLSAFRAIGRMRRSEPLFRDGEFTLLHLDRELLIFSRRRGPSLALTVINRSERGLSLRFATPVSSLLGGGRRARFFLYPSEGGVFRSRTGNTLRLCYDDGEAVYFK